MATATITGRGQITIPLEVRSKLGLKTGSQVEFVFEEDGSVRILNLGNPLERLPKTKTLTPRTIDRLLMRFYAAEVKGTRGPQKSK